MNNLRRGFFNILVNYFVKNIPFYFIRKIIYSLFIDIGHNSNILMGARLLANNIIIGNNSIINYGCVLDSRGAKIIIGDNVDIAPYVHIWTMEHDPQSPFYDVVKEDVVIKNYAWISSRSTIMPGVTIGEGAIVAAGSLVTKNVKDHEIVAGNPAKKIGTRNKNLKYCLNYKPWLN